MKNEHEQAQKNFVSEKDRLVNRLLSEKDVAISKINSELHDLMETLKHQQE